MFQNPSDLTPHAQKVFAFAADEARRLNHPYVATEHLLLGIIKLGNGVGVNVLRRMGIILDGLQMQVEFFVGSGTDPVMADVISFTPRVAKVLKLARKEAKAFNHSYVGTEHLLLGLIREGEGVAALLLKALNVDVERARHELLKEIDPAAPT